MKNILLQIQTPPLPEGLSSGEELMLYLGGLMVAGLIAAVVALWVANKGLNEYVRQQDLANLTTLKELGNFIDSMGKDLIKLEMKLDNVNKQSNDSYNIVKSIEIELRNKK